MPPIAFVGGGAGVGNNLGSFLTKVAGSGQVDVIAYSSGGLFVRAYLSGILPQNAGGSLNTSNPNPAIHPLIRKLVLIGTPNFGIATQLFPMPLLHGDHGAYYQLPSTLSQLLPLEVFPLSFSIWSLETWNQRGDDLRGVDTVAIAGNGDSAQATDGLVSVNSASVGFAFPDGEARTRVIPYCHGSVLLGSCSGSYIANVTGPDHPSYQIIRSFLDGGDAWKTVGVPASQASKTGGVATIVGGTVLGSPVTISPSSTPLFASQARSAGFFLDFIPPYLRGELSANVFFIHRDDIVGDLAAAARITFLI
jgi:hypothetical protein